QCVPVRGGPSVEAGCEPARIGSVDCDCETAFREKTTGSFEDLRGAGSAVAVPENDVGPFPPVGGAGCRRHRMAINEEITADLSLRLFDELTQRLMIGIIEALDAAPRLGEAQLLRVDLFPGCDDAGDRAKTHADPRRAGVDEIRQSVGKHFRVEL